MQKAFQNGIVTTQILLNMNIKSGIFIFIAIIFVSTFGSCQIFQKPAIKNEVLKDTITLRQGIPLYDPSYRFIILFDSVVADSRCPKDITCVWEGSAAVHLNFNNLQKEIQSVYTLDTHQSLNNDTTINNYYFKLLELNPYPEYQKEIKQKDYSLKIVVKEIQEN